MKCGTSIAGTKPKETTSPSSPVLAPSGATALKCPSCGGPIVPKFGEMIITCEYCGSGITLESDGWRGLQKQTMLPIKLGEKEGVEKTITGLMDAGLLHRHLHEDSTLEEMNLSLIPYWIVSVSARTSIIASDMAVAAGQVATTAALFGLMGAAMGGRRGGIGFGGPLVMGTMLGSTMGAGMGGRGGARKSFEISDNYNFPVVALKALAEYQPRQYQFHLDERTFFDVTKVPKGIKVLNGDIGEETAKYQAKALVTQLQSERAHAQYHMIQELHSEVDVAETEVLHAPIWFARYDHKGNKIVLVIDGNSGEVINSIGLQKSPEGH
jgi:hypothetical protein